MMICHRFVALDFLNSRLLYIDESGESAEWAVPSGGKLQDIQLAGNGRLLVSRNDGWALYDLTEGAVCAQVTVEELSGLATLRLLPDGTLLGGINREQGVELYHMNNKGIVLQKYGLPRFKDIRQLRRTPSGTWLLAHNNGGTEIQLNESACTLLKNFTTPTVRYAYQLSCAAGGNYRLSGGYSKSNIEFSPQGQILRELVAPQPHGMQSFFYAGFQYLNNGHLVQANWCGHDDQDYTHGLKMFEFDPSGEVVWSWTASKEQAGSILTFIILDDLDIAQAYDDVSGVLAPLIVD